MKKSLQERAPMTDEEREEALRLSNRYLNGESEKRMAAAAGISKSLLLRRIWVVNGIDSQDDPRIKRLKKYHRQRCRCHKCHHISHLTKEERDQSFEVYERYLNGTTLREMSRELGKTKWRVATMAAVGYGLKSTKRRWHFPQNLNQCYESPCGPREPGGRDEEEAAHAGADRWTSSTSRADAV